MFRNAIDRRVWLGSVAITLLFATASCLIAAGATAAEPRTVKVRVSDLDLASAKGQRTLARRIGVAVDEVCAHDGSTSPSILVARRVKQCKQAAEESVRRQLEQHGLSPMLLARR